jgi:hypothetical protein
MFLVLRPLWGTSRRGHTVRQGSGKNRANRLPSVALPFSASRLAFPSAERTVFNLAYPCFPRAISLPLKRRPTTAKRIIIPQRKRLIRPNGWEKVLRLWGFRWCCESAGVQPVANLGQGSGRAISLSGKVVDPEKRRAATDFTFSAPKSVSIAALVQQDERVLEAHHQAVVKPYRSWKSAMPRLDFNSKRVGRRSSPAILRQRYLPIPPVGRRNRSCTVIVW